MTRALVKVVLTCAALAVFLPAAAFAQEGQIAGTVRDASNAVMPGVTVEATSPALIEKVRSTTTDTKGQYQITNLPVGTYTVTFTLSGFTKQQRDGVVLTSGFTAPVNATMSVGQVAETVVVSGEAPTVDVRNAREVISLTGQEIKDLPTARNVNSLLEVTPAINSNYRPTTAFGSPGVCVGGIGVFCNPGVNGFNVGDTDTTNLAQGRVMVDGQVVNSALGTAQPVVGQTGGYTADIANAAEVNIQVTGALGDSETGGSAINIVPKTGGNRFAGDYNTTYTQKSWFGNNTSAYPSVPALFQAVISDHDVSGSYGGPIKRDKLWFFAVGRDQGIHKLPVGIDFWPNLWEGQWGYNYQPDRSKPRVEYKNQWINGSARITWQASTKNKFNFFWDEQDFCQDPCHGVVSVFTSPESWWSVSTKPDRLAQVSWTNPLTNKILLEGGLSYTLQYYSTASSRDYVNPQDLPRVIETGNTAGADATAPRVNQFAGTPGLFALTSGSLNSYINGGGAETRDVGAYRMRGSLSYITGSHHVKLGYDGAYYKQFQTNVTNQPQMTFNYLWPAANCNAAIGACGNTSLQFPNDPNNTALRPIPNTVDFNTGATTLNDHVMYTALYAQDQWTFRRLTLGGALRFDHATSGYGASCIGPNAFVKNAYCTKATDGVNYNDLGPRFSATWDVRGDGKTAVRFNG
ncbi:MAG: carboxypeptidase regulatory-like domain-containing protein, partial [Deltaproteobacteria bacterium]